ncbi:TPA: chorismate mutase [Salmonella enterica subsp. enterica serovar Paratyphi A]|uniref:chorismate mutase n=1 Tax=Salmonella paratyphi A TaxID=54388 RepID=A0A754Y8B2_SALPT|nr:chorismate mutase [Salmonella enterica subsp. enterica serovar Paratyphi A]
MVAELTALRDQIDDVDKALLNLLAKRLELVAKVGEVKSRFGLPIYVPEREASILASRRAEAEAIGVPPDLIEDVLRRVMRELFRHFGEGEGLPDGAAMDSEGCYWSAMFDGWRVARFSPQGEQLEEYRLPVRCPTMVCFGGADMKTLFITTTRENMSAQEVADYPLSGAIFTLQVAVAGMKKSRFIERQAGSTGTTFSLG